MTRQFGAQSVAEPVMTEHAVERRLAGEAKSEKHPRESRARHPRRNGVDNKIPFPFFFLALNPRGAALVDFDPGGAAPKLLLRP
jgi:hypothetical protein